jgi:C4-dicarboxylate transporter DctM subunit
VAQSVLNLRLDVIYRGIVPFLFIYLLALGLITYIPEISLSGMRFLFDQ